MGGASLPPPSGTGARPVLVKLGGELLAAPDRLASLAAELVRLAVAGPLIVLHGGGREIDAELARRGIARRAVEGVRVTGEEELPAVLSVLAGLVNTRLVAALAAAGGRPVGLTGADAALGLVEPAPPYRTADGRTVDLGRVGTPVGEAAPPLLRDLCALGYLPVVASIGIGRDGALYNVNADTFAAHLAVVTGAQRLIVAGATDGVLDAAGRPIARLDPAAIDRLIAAGGARDGMIAKLTACRAALDAGLAEVVIVDGRRPASLERLAGTRIVRAA